VAAKEGSMADRGFDRGRGWNSSWRGGGGGVGRGSDDDLTSP